MWGKWLAITRTKNPFIWNSTNDVTAHYVAGAMPTFGTGESA